LISPYARPGHINSDVLDYTSALAFIERNWKLAPLASRDAAATSIDAAFDFDSAPRAADVRFSEPVVASAPTRSVAVVYWCYGVVLCLVLGLVVFAAVRSRRTSGKPPSKNQAPRSVPVRAKI
ncbi:MAG: phospholipase, partial [Pseudonocardiales bacterium]|nr:phospholipase [Pseudonocardiales bacterium]